ncbi:MAG: DUF4301 family protein [Marinifilaceae bacterium]
MYSKEDLKYFKDRDIKPAQIDQQLENFKTGFQAVTLNEAATIGKGIRRIEPKYEEALLAMYENAKTELEMIKMVPASGSATRMFKDLYNFIENYTGSQEDFLDFLQSKGSGTMYDFFDRISEFAFYTHLLEVIQEKGDDLHKMIEKHKYAEILGFILNKKGLNYGNTPKGLIDFHIYRDFARTAFDEHLVEGALYANNGDTAKIHFTVSEEYLPAFQKRLKKVTKVFEKMFNIKYEVTFSVQKPSTDTVSIDEEGNLVRNDKGEILFRPAGHGALLHNLNDLDVDVVFIKNIDNVTPDRFKADTVKYKKLLAAVLLDTQETIFEFLHLLDKGKLKEEQFKDIELFIKNELNVDLSNAEIPKDSKKRCAFYHSILNRPIRVCGMVKNEGEPGGGPFFVKAQDGTSRLMIIESAQVDMSNKEQKKIFNSSTHFNPVDLICGIRNYKGKKFNLEQFVDRAQGFITDKSYRGEEIKVQELPGLWNGSMANWNTIFIEVPTSTFTPVKTVFDLLRLEHRNVLK